MSVWRVVLCLGVLFAAVGGLSACSSTAPQLDTLTQAEPDSTRQRAVRRLRLASAYFEQNQNDVAQQEVRAALQIDPNYADAYSLLGLIHQRDNALALAQLSFEHAIALASKPPMRTAELAAIQHNYGWFLCEQNRFTEAQTQFDLALAQPSYRQADKTRQAIALCKARQRNN
jgi:type IV pilus assembly protein PilF